MYGGPQVTEGESKHASVTFEGGRWLINDVGAANGIWSGSEKIEPRTNRRWFRVHYW